MDVSESTVKYPVGHTDVSWDLFYPCLENSLPLSAYRDDGWLAVSCQHGWCLSAGSDEEVGGSQYDVRGASLTNVTVMFV